MRVTTLPIEHRIKHREAIFTIHRSGDMLATGGLNGEVKVWTSESVLAITLKKHAGSIASVRFSRDGRYLATAGDDGFVHVYATHDWTLEHTVKHAVDATHAEWTTDCLLSADLGGVLVVTRAGDWAELQRAQRHEEPIVGLATSPDAHWAVTYSQGRLVLYRGLAVHRTATVEKRTVVEALNTRLSFAPNNKFLSVGLCFNQRVLSVDIFDTSLERAFSLVGHVAPSEVTAFCPLMFRAVGVDGNDGAAAHYCVLAVASQDLSVSLWTTVSPKPFLLLKRLTEAPVVDMVWEGTTLYLCSYDGFVKRVAFLPGELGDPVPDVLGEEECSLPLSTKNIELERSECNGEKVDENQKEQESFSSIKAPTFEFIINGNKLEEIQANLANDPNDPPIKVKPEELKPRRIAPKPMQPSASQPVAVAAQKSEHGVVLFDTNLPDKLRLARSAPFSAKTGIFTIALNAVADKLTVQREGRFFYAVTGQIAKVAYSPQYLVVRTAHVQVYELPTGKLILPYIAHRTAFLSLLGDSLLLINTYGDFLVLGLRHQRPIAGKLPRTKGLTAASLDPRYFIIAQYGDELLYYARRFGCWFALNPEFNSVLTLSPDFQNDADQTVAYLEAQLRNYVIADDQAGIHSVALQLFGIARRAGRLDDALAHKLEEAISCCRSISFVKKLLGKMNTQPFLHHFVITECKKYNI